MASITESFQPEETLIRRFLQGDGGAFDRLVELCSSRVFNLAYRLVGNRDDAQDIAQEAFVRIYHALPRFQGGSSFNTWMYRIVVNVCYDELKRRRRRPSNFTDLCDYDEPMRDPAGGVSAEEAAMRNERRRVLQQAIVTIPEPYRMVLVLYDLQGLSYQEISDILETNLGTIKSRLNRARLILREKLSESRELFGLGERRSN